MKRLLHRLAPILILLVMAGACWLLYKQLHQYRWKDIRQAWRDIPSAKVALAFGLMLLNYVVLMGYDYLAVRSIGHPLPIKKIALGSFIGFAVSYTFGALLGGTSVRYRMYSSWGLTTVEIVRLILIMGTTFWLGVFALGGIMFVISPFEIPEGLASLKLPFQTVQPLGWVLLGITAAYFILTVVWTKPIRFQGQDVKLPSLRMSVAQVVVAALDFAVAALCLYVMLPDDLGVPYTKFLAIYLLAWVAVVFSHVPGGVGLLELVIVTLTHASRKDAVVAALLAFRVIYYLLPAIVAVPIFFLHEATIRGSATNRLVARLFGENVLSGAMPIPEKPAAPVENAPPPG